jgi:hypothetical protein
MTLEDLVAKICKTETWKSSSAGTAGFEIEIPQPKGRKQKVFAAPFKDGADSMVRFTSMIGDVAKVDDRRARMALEINAKMPHGCLAIEGGHLVVTATRPLKTTTPESSAAAVKYLAKQADTYERLIYSNDDH